MDIEKATEELEAVVKAEEGSDKKEPDIKDELAKAAEDLEKDEGELKKADAPGEDASETEEDEGEGEGPGGMLISRKKRPKKRVKDTKEPEGDDATPEEHKRVRGGDDLANRSLAETVRDGFYKALTEDGETVELLEAGTALAHLASVLAKSMAEIAEAVEGLGEEIRAVAGRLDKAERAQVVGLKSQRLLHKAVDGIVVKAPHPGVIGRVGARDEKADNGKPSRAEIGVRLTQAVHAGKLEPDFLARFDARGEAVLAEVPEDVAKSFGIPKL